MFPYNGNYDATGTMDSSTSVTLETTTNPDYVVNYALPKAQDSRVPQVFTPKQFKNITFEFNEDISHGALWANDMKALSYGYSGVGTSNDSLLSSLLGGNYKIISCEYRTGEANCNKVQTGTFLGVPIYTYKYDGTVNWSTKWNTITSADLESTNWLTEKPVISSALEDYLESTGIQLDAYKYSIDNSYSPANGLQVRCVKE